MARVCKRIDERNKGNKKKISSSSVKPGEQGSVRRDVVPNNLLRTSGRTDGTACSWNLKSLLIKQIGHINLI